MNAEVKRKFQVIGSCAKSQICSSDEAWALADGALYNIDFHKDFSGYEITPDTTEIITRLLNYNTGLHHYDEGRCPYAISTPKKRQEIEIEAEEMVSNLLNYNINLSLGNEKRKNKLLRTAKDVVNTIYYEGTDVYFLKRNSHIPAINMFFSFVGSRIMRGDIHALNILYDSAWKEHPAVLRTINELQECFTWSEIQQKKNLSDEFLYYYAMLLLGEQSPLIEKNLSTAKMCFEHVASSFPQCKARLAYIRLLKSTECLRSQRNLLRINTLKKCANTGDLFSKIALAKILFQSFCDENNEKNAYFGIPTHCVNLLCEPCEAGHPVAIRFLDELFYYMGASRIGNMHKLYNWLIGREIMSYSLYDIKSRANMQIEAESPQNLIDRFAQNNRDLHIFSEKYRGFRVVIPSIPYVKIVGK